MAETAEHHWALITGATSGIGRAYARTLASAGFALVLCGRRHMVLAELAASLKDTTTEVIVGDLTDASVRRQIRSRILEGAPPDVVVANAGFGNDRPFADSEAGDLASMADVHVTSVAELTSAALRVMAPRQASPVPPVPLVARRSIVIVASMAAFLPAPGPAMYIATKSFGVTLARAIAPQAAAEGVQVQALCPGFTHTEFHDKLGWSTDSRRSRGLVRWMTADAVVAFSIRKLQRRSRFADPVAIPGWTNRLLLAVVRALPRRIYARLARTLG